MVQCVLGVHTTPAFRQVFAPCGSPLGQIDDWHPLVHAPALPAEAADFAQGGVFPRC